MLRKIKYLLAVLAVAALPLLSACSDPLDLTAPRGLDEVAECTPKSGQITCW